MRPLQWLERHASRAFAGVLRRHDCGRHRAVGRARRTPPSTRSLVLAARLKRRIAVRLRDDCSAGSTALTSISSIACPAAISPTSSSSRPTARPSPSTRCWRSSSARASRSSTSRALFFLSWPLTTLVVVLAVALGSALSFVYGRLKTAGVELTDLNHRMAALLGAVVLRRAHRARDALAGTRDRALSRAEHRPGRRRGAQRRGALAALSHHRDAGRRRGDGDRHLRLHLPRAPGLHAEQLPARLRLRPAAAAAAAQSALRTARPPRLSGRRHPRSEDVARHAALPERPFGTATFTGLEHALASSTSPTGIRTARPRSTTSTSSVPRGPDDRDRRTLGRRQVDAREHPAPPPRAVERAA